MIRKQSQHSSLRLIWNRALEVHTYLSIHLKSDHNPQEVFKGSLELTNCEECFIFPKLALGPRVRGRGERRNNCHNKHSVIEWAAPDRPALISEVTTPSPTPYPTRPTPPYTVHTPSHTDAHFLLTDENLFLTWNHCNKFLKCNVYTYINYIHIYIHVYLVLHFHNEKKTFKSL